MNTRIHTSLALLSVSVASLALLPACSGPQAPDAFHLTLQMDGVIPEAIDLLRVRFTPQTPAMGETPRFAPLTDPSQSIFEDGAITLEVDPGDGTLLMTITGNYVREHMTVPGDPDDPRLTIDVWSDDRVMRMAPQMRAVIVRGSEQIAEGAAFLPAWPLGEHFMASIRVVCRTTSLARCSTP